MTNNTWNTWGVYFLGGFSSTIKEVGRGGGGGIIEIKCWGFVSQVIPNWLVTISDLGVL